MSTRNEMCQAFHTTESLAVLSLTRNTSEKFQKVSGSIPLISTKQQPARPKTLRVRY